MKLSPEWQVILRCARASIRGEQVPRIERHCLSTLYWDHLTALACRHGIAPLVYHHLRQIEGVSALPLGTIDGLRRTYYANAVRNTVLYQELHGVLSTLEEIGSQVIVLKGAALAETVYPHRAVRPMSDIDLLVRPEEVARVEDTLIDLGYALRPHPRGQAWLKTHYYELSFVKTTATASAIPLELHWHIDRPSRPFAIDLEGVWARAVPARIAGVAAWMFAPEDVLLHLCLHACKHGLTGSLRPFCDLAATIQRYGQTIDWEQLHRRAADWRVTPYAYLPLQLARDIVAAGVPESCLRALKPEGFDARLLSWATTDLLEDRATPALFPALLRLWRGPRVRDRLAIMAKILSPAAVAKAYGIAPSSKRLYGYYPVRLTDLLRRYGPTWWRLCRQDPHLIASAEAKAQLAQWLQPFNQRGDDERPQAR